MNRIDWPGLDAVDRARLADRPGVFLARIGDERNEVLRIGETRRQFDCHASLHRDRKERIERRHVLHVRDEANHDRISGLRHDPIALEQKIVR